MSSKEQIPDSDASEEDSDAERVRTPDPGDIEEPSPQQSTLSHRFRESPKKTSDERKRDKNSGDSIAVMVPAPARPWEYQPYRGDTTVDTVLELKVMDDREWYTIDYEDGKRELVSCFHITFQLKCCQSAFCFMEPFSCSPFGSLRGVGVMSNATIQVGYSSFAATLPGLYRSDSLCCQAARAHFCRMLEIIPKCPGCGSIAQ